MGKLNVQPGPAVDNSIAKEEQDISKDQVISHAWFWPRMGQWLQAKDIVITETGTCRCISFGSVFGRHNLISIRQGQLDTDKI